QVCRLLKDALDSNAYLLRYKILLAVYGLVDVPSPHQGKLSLLMKHHSRVVDGVYTNTGSRYFSCAETSSLRGQEATGPDTDQWRLSLAFGGTISYTILKPLDGVVDIYEPSHLPGDHTMSHWSVPLGFFPGVDTWGVSVDTTQDLLLVAKRQPHGETDWDITVHVRSLKRPDAPHPRARSHSLCTAPLEPECYGVSNIQIHDQFVIWMLDTLFGRQVEVWNWCTGAKIWEHLFPGPGFITYTLLDAAHILVTSDRWDELRVYRFDPPDESADVLLRLGFPFEDRCRPRIQQSSIPAPPPNVPFWPDPKLRILIVFYYSMVSTPPIGALMIPYTTFRRLLHPKSTTQPTYTPPLRVPWEQWGPQGSVDLQVP
ncbi:hypothetical protein L226DRAFT_432461, partial [Lentinus tigrinus ALCF2SS1-7]|uniref:uncharacterized protein n=1 Tax=Lentinus tigrinus ALCF2SS1-7 TaxID=1328758 RepID=UPI001165F43B